MTESDVFDGPGCPACGGPPVGSEGHGDYGCPATWPPGQVRRGPAPRPRRSDETLPLDDGDPWDTSATLLDADGWPKL